MTNRACQWIATVVAVCLVAGAVAIAAHRVLRLHGGLVTADPVAYLAFGRNLQHGSWFLGGHLGECLEHFARGGELRTGPIWNTHVLPSGKAVYTVAVGYPGFQALLLHLGGVWLSLHANLALLALALILLVLCVWEGAGRDLRAFALGGAAAVVFALSQPQAFANFAYPWREPLFYVCVLGAAWCMLRFSRTGQIAALAGSGLLLGLACSVKEACIVYAAVVGLYFLCLPAFRDGEGRVRRLAVVCAAGAIGLSPLLIQNLACTGNPFTSLQFMRAAPHYAAPLTAGDAEAGLRLGNLRYVVFWYIGLYRDMPLFQWPFLALAAVGLWPALRRPAGRLLLLLAAGHVLLYLQWARSDFRHMYFAHAGYGVAVASGAFLLIDTAGRLLPTSRRRGVLRLLYPLPSVALALWTTPYLLLGAPEPPRFNYAKAAALTNALRERLPRDAVVLSNRKLRDVLIAHQLGQVVRLEDLRWFHPRGDHAAVLDRLLAQRAPVYFLDNQDQDPGNIAGRDLLRSDLRRLTDTHDLVPVDRLAADAYAAGFLTGGEVLTVYRVEPRRLERVARTLTAPADGAAFLQLYPRDLGPRLEVRLDGAPIGPERPGDALYPCAGRSPAPAAELTIEARGALLPAFPEARLIGWEEDIRLPCGGESLPDDRFLFPGSDAGAVLSQSRSFAGPFRLRVPVRECDGRFTVIGLGLVTERRGVDEAVRISGAGIGAVSVPIAGDAAWFALPKAAPDLPHAGLRELQVALDPPDELRLKRVISRTARTRIDVPEEPEAFGYLVLGVLMPERPGDAASAWRLTRAGKALAGGEIGGDPRRGRNRLLQLLRAPAAEPPLELEGAGVMGVRILPIGRELAIPERWSLCGQGFYPREWSGSEYFAWTDGHGIIACPVEVRGGSRAYRLTMSVSNGHPDLPPRRLTVRIAGAEAVVDLPAERAEVALELEIPGPLPRGLQDLHLETDAWTPADVRDTDDRRRLGARFYGVTWGPRE